MKAAYKSSKEQGEVFAVSCAKTGIIIAEFGNKYDAQDYLAAQVRADEQSQVMSRFNEQQEMQALVAEFRKEFFA